MKITKDSIEISPSELDFIIHTAPVEYKIWLLEVLNKISKVNIKPVSKKQL